MVYVGQESSVEKFGAVHAKVKEGHDEQETTRGASLRELRRFFKEHDKDEGYAGLRRIADEDGTAVWTILKETEVAAQLEKRAGERREEERRHEKIFSAHARAPSEATDTAPNEVETMRAELQVEKAARGVAESSAVRCPIVSTQTPDRLPDTLSGVCGELIALRGNIRRRVCEPSWTRKRKTRPMRRRMTTGRWTCRESSCRRPRPNHPVAAARCSEDSAAGSCLGDENWDDARVQKFWSITTSFWSITTSFWSITTQLRTSCDLAPGSSSAVLYYLIKTCSNINRTSTLRGRQAGTTRGPHAGRPGVVTAQPHPRCCLFSCTATRARPRSSDERHFTTRCYSSSDRGTRPTCGQPGGNCTTAPLLPPTVGMPAEEGPPSPPPSPPGSRSTHMPPVLVDSGYRTSATYRLADPIENMQLEVTLRKRGTRGERRIRDAASEKPKGPRKPGRSSIAFGRTSRADPEQEEQEDPDAEETAGAPGAAGAAGAEVEEEDVVVASTVFHWQEKIFSPSEVSEVRKDVRRASRAEGGGGLLARFFSRQRDDFVRVRRRALPGPNPDPEPRPHPHPHPNPDPDADPIPNPNLSPNPNPHANPSPDEPGASCSASWMRRRRWWEVLAPTRGTRCTRGWTGRATPTPPSGARASRPRAVRS
eukprot:scaffold64780_cov56-Phaeocystis_antarctica.AAC.3